MSALGEGAGWTRRGNVVVNFLGLPNSFVVAFLGLLLGGLRSFQDWDVEYFYFGKAGGT